MGIRKGPKACLALWLQSASATPPGGYPTGGCVSTGEVVYFKPSVPALWSQLRAARRAALPKKGSLHEVAPKQRTIYFPLRGEGLPRL